MVPPVLIHQPWIIPPPPHCFVRFILRRVLSRFPPRSLEVKLPSSSHPQLLPCPRQTSSVLLAALSIIFAPPPLLSENELKLQQPRLINGAPKFREVKAEVQTQMSDSRWSVAESLFLPPPSFLPSPLPHLEDQRPSTVSGRPSWPGRCWPEWRPRSGSSPWWWTAWSSPGFAARCRRAGLPPAPWWSPASRWGSSWALVQVGEHQMRTGKGIWNDNWEGVSSRNKCLSVLDCSPDEGWGQPQPIPRLTSTTRKPHKIHKS